MSYGQYNPYSGPPAQDAGQGYGEANPYGGQYEMQNYNNQQYQQPPQQQYDGSSQQQPTQDSVLTQIKQLREAIDRMPTSTQHIGDQYRAVLGSPDGRGKNELERAEADAHASHVAIKDGIKQLERDIKSSPASSRNVGKQQLPALKETFKQNLEMHRQMEYRSKEDYKSQIVRQLGAIKPADQPPTDDEIDQVMRGNVRIFESALHGHRREQANAVLGNVKARHNEIQRIEQDMAEITQLQAELAAMVEEQDAVVMDIDQNAEHTVDNMEAGNQQVKIATDHARRARKLKWWCLVIVVIIIIVVALGVGLGICLNSNKCGSK